MKKEQIIAVTEARVKAHLAKLYYREEILSGSTKEVDAAYAKIEKTIKGILTNPAGLDAIMQVCDDIELKYLQPTQAVPDIKSNLKKLTGEAIKNSMHRREYNPYKAECWKQLDTFLNSK